MKIIDLLNLIASGKTPPTGIRWLGKVYNYNGIDYVCHEDDEDDDWLISITHLMDHVALCKKWLNEEVEVLNHE